MRTLQSSAVCFLAVIGATVSVSFIKPCKPNDNACLKASAIVALPHFVAGIPDIGLQAGDPILLDNVGNDDKNFKLAFKDMKVTGISKCTVIDMSRNLDESTMTLIVECPIVASGQYSLSGQLLFIPAEGKGDFDIKTDKTQIQVTINVKEVEKAGVKYWKISKFDYSYDIIGKASINLENLFGGDETSAKPIREALQNSAKEIIKEVGDPIIKEILKKEINLVQKFFFKVPISELQA